MSDPTSRPASASHPTRQQLDDLDALMQRMLALPVNQGDEQAGPAASALPDLGVVAVEPPPIALAPPETKPAEPPKPAPVWGSEPRVEAPPINYRHPEPPQPPPVQSPEPRVEAPPVNFRLPELPQLPPVQSPEPRVEAPPVNYRLPEPPQPEPRVEAPPVNYRLPEPPQPAPVQSPEPRVERPSVEYRPEHPVIDYRRVEAPPAVDYRRVEVAPVVPPRVEMPKPEYRIADVPPMHIPDVTPLAPPTPPSAPSPAKPVEKPAAVNGNGAEPRPQSPPKLNGKQNLLEPVRINVRLEAPPRHAPLVRHKPPRAFRRPITGLMLAPFIWMNLTFDRWVGRFGPLGRSFRTPGGRTLLGWLGLAFLSAAVAWAVLNGMGWTR
jgi:hypothetical protein